MVGDGDENTVFASVALLIVMINDMTGLMRQITVIMINRQYSSVNRKTCASCQCYKRELQSQTTTAATSTAFGTGFNYAVSRCEVVFVCVALPSM